VPLPATARDGLLAYARLLLTWGERINLTAAKSVEALISDQLPDSFAIAARLARHTVALNVIDVGSGGGLPAIPLALLRPADRFALVEATGKKVAFLRTAIRDAGLGDRMRVEHRRIEESGDETGDLFDVATSRAMLPPAEWLALARRLVRVGGVALCLGTDELEVAPEGLRLIGQASYRGDRWVAELERST
jgi:16S rRNA (guanine527-N7)-methyltransferase